VIPLPQILAELIMAVGGALFAANAWALAQPYVRRNSTGPVRVQARGKVLINMSIGLIVFVWGFASFLAR
jgi:hypothetical protein